MQRCGDPLVPNRYFRELGAVEDGSGRRGYSGKISSRLSASLAVKRQCFLIVILLIYNDA